VITFAFALFFYGIFCLNLNHFFSLKQNDKVFFVQNDNTDFLNTYHIGLMLKNAEINSAIFILPDNGYEYNINEFLSAYKKKQKSEPDAPFAPDTVYIAKSDISCLYKETCGEFFEKILKSAEKYNMIPETYDLTNKIIRQNAAEIKEITHEN